jgi:hypothetical protein
MDGPTVKQILSHIRRSGFKFIPLILMKETEIPM